MNDLITVAAAALGCGIGIIIVLKIWILVERKKQPKVIKELWEYTNLCEEYTHKGPQKMNELRWERFHELENKYAAFDKRKILFDEIERLRGFKFE